MLHASSLSDATMGTKRQRVLSRKTALWNELSRRREEWRDIRDYLIPRAGRFDTLDRNDSRSSRYRHIYDSTGMRAHRVLSAGMMAGMTSPARPWFRVATPDEDLMEYAPVKAWLNKLTLLKRNIFARSNTYQALHSVYEELGAFGTSLDVIVGDYEDVIRHHPMTIGEYALAIDERGVVNTFMREMLMTVEQIVRKFGRGDNVSTTVRNLFTAGKLDTLVPVLHYVYPRENRDVAKKDARNMRFASCYYEMAGEGDAVLGESGFNSFPAIAPRWLGASGADVYGEGPGHEAIGDIKQLQHEQLRKGEAIDYQTQPPLQAPQAAHGQAMDLLPGGMSYVDTAGPTGGIRTAFEVRLDLSHLLADLQDVRQRIDSTFYVDMFLMLANDTRSGITAREIAERHEEKLLMLGPVLERLHNEMLGPLIDMTFDRIIDAGLMPPPPPELQDQELKIEFVSTLAQAQRAVGLASVDRLLGTVGAIAQVKPEVIDKIDADQIVDKYADMLGVDPSMIVPDEKVAEIREQRAQQAAMQQAAMAAQTAAATAKDLGAASTGEDTALASVMDMFSGYGGMR